MFDVLPASGAHLHLSRPQWVTTSLITHAVALTLALAISQQALEKPVAVPEEAILLFVPKPAEPEPEPAQPKPAEPAANLVIAEPPPKGFQTVAAPSEIPNFIPEIDLSQRPLDPRDFTGIGVEGGIAEGVVGGTGVVTADPGAVYEATAMLEGFEPAVVLSQPAPKYPALLLSAGLTGAVMVEFIVDTTGRVEPSSLEVIESNHRLFEASARATVLDSKFRPARLGPRPVRQLTRQRVRFVRQ